MLCLVNGSPSAIGLVTDAALVDGKRFDLAAEVFALAFEAFNAPLGHLDAALGEYWNNPCDGWALGRLRELVGGGHGGPRRPCQAPVSFRIAPRLAGLEAVVRGIVPDLTQPRAFGPVAGSIAEALRREVYPL